jgi:hypothetical protein
MPGTVHSSFWPDQGAWNSHSNRHSERNVSSKNTGLVVAQILGVVRRTTTQPWVPGSPSFGDPSALLRAGSEVPSFWGGANNHGIQTTRMYDLADNRRRRMSIGKTTSVTGAPILLLCTNEPLDCEPRRFGRSAPVRNLSYFTQFGTQERPESFGIDKYLMETSKALARTHR